MTVPRNAFFGSFSNILNLAFENAQDILKDQWSPALTIKTALLSLQALLCSPEAGDPQDAEVAKVLLKNAVMSVPISS